ncbi:radical SAM protein [Clostridia bacterium]|nr:radical SAM protein [Clostridia bacterium]
MRYIGNVFRPPSEAYSLIIQVTLGCAHNGCTFCSMYRDKSFQIRKEDDIIKDLQECKQSYRRVERIFLADGDALVLKTDVLVRILDVIKELFPECERVGIYGSPHDVLRKSAGDLVRLREHGLGIVYIGAESGSDRVLKSINKGANRDEIIEAVRKIEDSGLPASVTFISGMAGQDGWEEHATETGRMISEMNPTYVGLLTLMVEPEAPIYEDIESGRFKRLSPVQTVEESRLLLENINVEKDCVFRSNHASNYISLRGTLPRDKDKLLDQLKLAAANEDMLKDERFRLL